MKKSEKIFMAINNIDEQLIDEAKGKDEKPVLIRVEKHLHVKEIIAFAACFVLLAAGVFTLFKFRAGVEPVDSGVPTNSSGNSDIASEDKELQSILKDLTANAMEIDGIFTRLADQGEGYLLKIDGAVDYIGTYYPIGDNRKTEPSGLFTVPQTRSELERLLLTCFTSRAVENYMNDVCTGRVAANDDGKNILIADQSKGNIRLIEADGKLYRESYEYDVKLDIDYTTAMVTLRTDKTIKFTYSDTNGVLSGTEGVIVLENSSWKLDYFYDVGFIPVMPTEFTDDDKELHGILNELSAGKSIYTWFFHGVSLGPDLIFKFSNNTDNRMYVLLPKGEKNYSGLEYPQMCEQVEELLLKYFTQETTDEFMKTVGKGTMTQNSDGTYTVTTEIKEPPIFIEIDGNMYLWDRPSGGPDIPIWDTAQITEKTSESIKFTIVCAMYDQYYIKDGLIKYERGGWKLNYDWEGFDAEDEPAEINTGILSDIGLTYQQLVEKRGELVTNTYKGVLFKNGIGIYGWKSEGSSFSVDNDHTNPGGLPDAGGCNVILGLSSSALLTNFTSPMSLDGLCERYGFVLESEETEPGLNGYSATFTHPLYDNVTFVADTGETKGSIDDNTVWWIFLNVDSKRATPII